MSYRNLTVESERADEPDAQPAPSVAAPWSAASRRGSPRAPVSPQTADGIVALQRSEGNCAVSRMLGAAWERDPVARVARPPAGGSPAPRVARASQPGERCPCGGTVGADGECDRCRAKREALEQSDGGGAGARISLNAALARSIAREAAPPAASTPGGACGALASLADTIGQLRGRAATALAGSGLRAADVARIRRDIDHCAASESRFRRMAAAGDEAAAAQVLGAFTQDGINSVLPRLTRVTPEGVAASGPSLATLRLARSAIGTGQLPTGRKLMRLLDGNAVREAARNVQPAVPAITAGAAAGAAAAASAPLWVWVVVAVVVVVALVGVAYWVFSDDTETATQPQPQPQPERPPAPLPDTDVRPAPDAEPDTRERRREREPCPLPANELTEFVQWGSARDGMRTSAGWRQTLVPSDPGDDWTGCEVFETGPVDDQCWVPGSPCPRSTRVDGSTWTCSGDEWGPDWVGTGEGCVDHYQQHSSLPCRITADQTMHIVNASGTPAYKQNELVVEIHPDKVVSMRDDEVAERPWPPQPGPVRP